jgi:ABC-2 type transport system permease protein
MTAGFLGAVVGGLDMGDTSTMAATTMWALLFTTLAGLFGLGVGMIVRHGSGAISGLLVWWLVVENMLTLFLPDSVSRFLPFFAGSGLLAIQSDTPSRSRSLSPGPRTPASSAATPPSRWL